MAGRYLMTEIVPLVKISMDKGTLPLSHEPSNFEQWQGNYVQWGAVGWNSYGLDGGTCILLSLELFCSISRGSGVIRRI